MRRSLSVLSLIQMMSLGTSITGNLSLELIEVCWPRVEAYQQHTHRVNCLLRRLLTLYPSFPKEQPTAHPPPPPSSFVWKIQLRTTRETLSIPEWPQKVKQNNCVQENWIWILVQKKPCKCIPYVFCSHNFLKRIQNLKYWH